MAEQAASLMIPAWVNRLRSYRTLIVPIGFMMLLAVVVVPVPPFAMDMLIAANLAIAALILLTTVYITKPLDFSVFPSLLLATTLLRLVLNIATTRLILSADASTPAEAVNVAGKVISSFSMFVAGNQIVVGLIMFLILIVVQFVVITKGATRISEVAARFTLDAMPGKQMAIDADLNAGIINEHQAKNRREEIAQEADFYGAMDGAAKFVRGDAIAGIIITIINITGGFVVGAFIKGWDFGQTAEVFTMLTIGDGLVSQLPAFVISMAAGLIVTRSSSRQDLGSELTSQLTSRPAALGITSGFLALMAFTGLPATPLFALAGVTGGLAWYTKKQRTIREEEARDVATKEAPKAPEADPIEQALGVDLLELEVGYGLVRLVDAGQGGDLLNRITMIRRQLAGELGLVMPPVRIRDNMQLQSHDYQLKIRGNTIAKGAVYPGKFLAMDSGLASGTVDGIHTREPAFGLDAVWIDAGQKQRAEALNYTVVDAASVLATHITELVKSHAFELLTREETGNLLTQLKERAPKLYEEVLGGDSPMVRAADVQRVLQNLLRERVSIRDMESIIETLGDWSRRTKDLDVLTEYVRNALRRTICNQYVEQVHDTGQGADMDFDKTVSKLFCISLDPALEDRIAGFIDRGNEGTTMTMPPQIANRVVQSMLEELQQLIQAGHQPVVLASPQVRAQVRQLIEPHMPNAAVLGYNEISKGVNVESLGLAADPS